MLKSSPSYFQNLSEKVNTLEWSQHVNKASLQNCINGIAEFIQTDSNSVFTALDAKPGHGKTLALQLICYQAIRLKASKNIVTTPLLIVLNEKKQQDYLETGVANLFDSYNQKLVKKNLLCINSDNVKFQKQNVAAAYIIVITHSRLLNLLAEFEDCGEDYARFSHESFFSWQNKDSDSPLPRKIIIDEAPPFFEGFSFGLDHMEWLNPLLKSYSLESIPMTKAEKENSNFLLSQEEHTQSPEDQAIQKSINKEREYRQRYHEIVIRCAFQAAFAKLFLDESSPYSKKLRDYVNMDDNGYIERFFAHVDVDKYEGLRDSNLIAKYDWLKRLYHFDKVGMFDCESKQGNKKILCSRRLDFRKFSRSVLIMDGTFKYTSLRYNQEFQCISITDETKYNRVKVLFKNYATSASNRKKRQGSVQKLIAKNIADLRADDPTSKILPLTSKDEIAIYRGLGAIEEEQKNYFEHKIQFNQLPIHILNTRGKNFMADYNQLYLTSLPIRNPEFYKLQAVSLYADSPNLLNFEMKEAYDDSEDWFLDRRIQQLYKEDLLGELIQIIHRTDLRKLNILKETSHVKIYIASKLNVFLEKLLKGTPFMTYSDPRTDTLIRHQATAANIAQGIIDFTSEKKKIFPIRAGQVNRKTKKFLINYYPDTSSTDISPETEKYMSIIDKEFAKKQLVVVFIETKTGKKERRIDKTIS